MPHSERSIHILSPKFPCHQFSNHILFCSPDRPLAPGPETYTVTHLAISLPSKAQPGSRAQRSSHWKACPHSCPSSGMSPRSAGLQLSLYRSDACISRRTICKPGPSLFLPCQQDCRDLLLSHRCGWEREGRVAGGGGHHGHSSHFLCVPYLCLWACSVLLT